MEAIKAEYDDHDYVIQIIFRKEVLYSYKCRVGLPYYIAKYFIQKYIKTNKQPPHHESIINSCLRI